MNDVTTIQHHDRHPESHPADYGHHDRRPDRHPADHGHHDLHIEPSHNGPHNGGPDQAQSMLGGMGAAHQAPSNHGRDKIDWPHEVWSRIDAAVREEIMRARVAAKFLPTVHVPAKSTTVPADVIATLSTSTPFAPGSPAGALAVDEWATTKVNEFWVEFVLTPAQIEEEAAAVHPASHHQHSPNHQHHINHHNHHAHASTGITLATRAANILAQVEDTVLFQGQNAFAAP